jgi:hypothetical protein
MKYLLRGCLVFIVGVIALLIYYPARFSFLLLWELKFDPKGVLFETYTSTEPILEAILMDETGGRTHKTFFCYLYAVMTDGAGPFWRTQILLQNPFA